MHTSQRRIPRSLHTKPLRFLATAGLLAMSLAQVQAQGDLQQAQAQGSTTVPAASPSKPPLPGAQAAPQAAPMTTISAWMGAHRSALENGLELRKAARRLVKALKNEGWTESEIPPYKNLEGLHKPSQTVHIVSDDELLALTREYDDRASAVSLETLKAAREALTSIAASSPALSTADRQVLEQQLGYSKLVDQAQVSPSLFVEAMQRDLFDPADDVYVGRAVRYVRDTLNSSVRATSVLDALEVMRRAYEMRQQRPILDLLSPRWHQLGSTLQDATSMGQALANDYRNLINIRLYFFPGAVVERGSEYSVSFYWSRRAFVARSGQDWVLEQKYTTFVFAREDGKLRLIRSEGDLPFGLTDRFGYLTVSEGTLNGVAVAKPTRIDNGVITAPQGGTTSTAVSGTSTIRIVTPGVGTGYSMATQQQAITFAAPFGDVVFTTTFADVTLGGSGLGQAGYQVLATNNYASVTSVPTSGYQTATTSTTTLAQNGRVVAVRTADGHYAKLQVLRCVLGPQTGYSTTTFSWTYQPGGTPTF